MLKANSHTNATIHFHGMKIFSSLRQMKVLSQIGLQLFFCGYPTWYFYPMKDANNHSMSLFASGRCACIRWFWREDLVRLYGCPAGLAVTAESFSSQPGSQGWSAHTMPSSHGHLNDLIVALAGRMSRPYIQIRPHALQRVHMYRCSDKHNLCYCILLLLSLF